MRLNFQEVSIKGVRKWNENGKKRQQTKKFWQTINPFNKNPDGSVKTYEQIMGELIVERNSWLKGGE